MVKTVTETKTAGRRIDAAGHRRLKSAILAWLILNLFLIPVLGSNNAPDQAVQEIDSLSLSSTGNWGRITPITPLSDNIASSNSLDAHQPNKMGEEVINTVSHRNNQGLFSYILYALTVIAFWSLVFVTKDFTGYGLPKAVFAIGLMFAIPIYSSKAMAADGINRVTLHGQEDNIENLLRPVGIMVLDANVTLAGEDPIMKDRVFLSSADGQVMNFSECSLSHDTPTCQMSADKSYAICECVHELGVKASPGVKGSPLPRGRNTLHVWVNDINGHAIPLYWTKTFFVDDIPPTISPQFTAVQKLDKLHVEIGARDMSVGTNSEGSSVCAGIDKIEFYQNDTLLSTNTIDVSQDPNDCSAVTEEEDIPIPQSGKWTFRAVVYDNLGNSVNSTDVTLVFDSDPPIITESTFKIYQGGNEVLYMSNAGSTSGVRAAEIEFTVDDENFDYAYANLSVLNDNLIYKDRYKLVNVTADKCSKSGSTYVCHFSKQNTGGHQEDLFIRTAATNLQFNLTAVDKSGLSTSQTMTASLNVDNTRPEVTNIGTFKCNQNKCYYKKGPVTFKVLINEADSGFDNGLVFLKTQSVTGNNQMHQMWCNNDGASWRCILNAQAKKSSEGSGHVISLGALSQDDAANPVGGATQAQVFYDSTPPTIDADASSVQSLGTDGILRPYHESGDTLVIRVEGFDKDSGIVDDKGQWDVSIETREILDTGVNWTQADLCEQGADGKFACTWENLGPIVKGPKNLTQGLKVKARDVAGNLNDSFSFKPFVIYHEAISQPGDVWSLKDDINCTPEALDRNLVRYYHGGNKIWCDFTLEASGNYKALSLDRAGECIPQDNATKNYFSKSQIFGDQLITSTGRKEPSAFTIISFDAQTIDPDVSELSLICPYQIIYVDKAKHIYEAEIENISIKIPVINGNAALDTTLHNQVDELKDSLKGSNWIGTVDKVFNQLRNICTLVNSVVVIINTVTGLFGGLDWIPIWNAKQVLGSAANAMNRGKDSVYTIFMISCYVIECKINPLSIAGADGGYTKFVNAWVDLTVGDWTKLPGVSATSTQKKFAESVANDFANSNPRDSLLLSTLMLCIPGVLYNLNKVRQIDCFYVLCMEKMVPLGTPVYACKSSRGLMYCKYVIGQIGAIVPFVQLIKQFGSLISSILSDPMALIGFGLGVACSGNWLSGVLGLGSACEYPLAAMQLISTGNALATLFDQWEGQDYCAEALA